MRLKEFLQQGGLVSDPNKIQSIINKYGNGKSPFKASDYIEVSRETGVPVELLLAQGIAESNLGTAGRAVRTKNVGNVGNTDSGAAEYRQSWKDGLYRQANLLKKEYKVSGFNDIQRLVGNNFKRPIGGNYASAPDYGVKVGKLINSFSNIKLDINSSNPNQIPNQGQVPYQQMTIDPYIPQMPQDMYANLNDWSNFKNYAKKNPTVLDNFSVDTQKQFAENIRLENERALQEQNKAKVEQENQQIQFALQEKQRMREQILSMVPQAQSINSGNIQAHLRDGGKIKDMFYAQKGGWVPFSERSVNPEAIKTFYNDMINSDWYKERLQKNGYDSNLNPANWFTDGAQNEADFRSRRVQYARVNKIDPKKVPFSAQEAQRYKDLDATGTHWMPRTNEVNYRMNDLMLDDLRIEPREIITHELGHAESAGRLNDYEYNLLESNLSSRTKDNHDKNPYENKADINTLRYNLFREGLYDPKTGKYKTKTGKFEKGLLEKVKSSFMSRRLRQNYDDDKLEMLMNTIAYNDLPNDENTTAMYAKLGGILKDIKNKINNEQ